MPGFCISGSGFQVALGDTFGGVAWFIGEVRGDQHHYLEHHQTDFALGAEYALIVEGEQQGQGDLLNQLAEGLGVAAQQALRLEAGEQGGEGALQDVEPGADAAGQFRQAPGQVGQVLEQEAEQRQAFDDQVQEQPVILGFQVRIGGRGKAGGVKLAVTCACPLPCRTSALM